MANEANENISIPEQIEWLLGPRPTESTEKAIAALAKMGQGKSVAARIRKQMTRTIVVEGRPLVVEEIDTDVTIEGLKARFAGKMADTRDRASVYLKDDGTFAQLNILKARPNKPNVTRSYW